MSVHNSGMEDVNGGCVFESWVHNKLWASSIHNGLNIIFFENGLYVRMSQKISIFLDKDVWKNINFLLTKVFVWCSVVQCVAACCSVLQCLAVSCSALKCLPACFNALQCDAVSCSVLQCTHRKNWIVAVCCSVLQCVPWQVYTSSIPWLLTVTAMKLRMCVWKLIALCWMWIFWVIYQNQQESAIQVMHVHYSETSPQNLCTI